jgi:LPS-assembly protein
MRKLVVLSALSCLPIYGYAQTNIDTCHSTSETRFLPLFEGDLEQANIEVQASDAQIVDQGTSVFRGDVDIKRANQQLNADRATYNKVDGEISARGNVTLRDSDMVIDSEQAEWSMIDDTGILLDAEYQIREMNARGNASHVLRKGNVSTRLKNATYTTCQKGDNAWILEADKVNLDHVEAVGEAEDVVIKLAGLPVFYTPYINFPLNDERKSGFLTPSIGSSNETGFDLTTPYYFNIAPNLDATVSPRVMSDRGLLLSGEFRYLFEKGDGVIDAGYLNNDNLSRSGDEENPHHDESRKHFSWEHSSQLSDALRVNLDYNYVSDDDYIEDFSSSLSLASTTHLKRDFRVTYNQTNWRFLARAQGYQTITDAIEPYKRLPQLKFSGELPEQLFGLTFGLESEYVDFDHDELVAGQRYNIEPSITLPIESLAGFIKPRIAVQHTRYDLDKNVNLGQEDSLTRTLPILSLDSGLFFERQLNFSNTKYIQTLEPRAFYLYVPERDQSDIPDFDTGLNTFRYSQLFSHNRFSGTDRVGDANQLSLAVTTRFINQQTGREAFNFTLGQIRYFKDRKVTLNEAVGRDNDSDFVAQMSANITQHWTLNGEIQWDPDNDSNNLSSIQARYRGGNGSILNVGHRYRRDDIEQIDMSAYIPLSQQWSVVGRWYRSIRDSRTLEALAGVEYQSCCWATRFVARNYVNDVDDNERNLAFLLQIELKGLGSFGQKSDSLLRNNIIGYGSK